MTCAVGPVQPLFVPSGWKGHCTINMFCIHLHQQVVFRSSLTYCDMLLHSLDTTVQRVPEHLKQLLHPVVRANCSETFNDRWTTYASKRASGFVKLLLFAVFGHHSSIKCHRYFDWGAELATMSWYCTAMCDSAGISAPVRRSVSLPDLVGLYCCWSHFLEVRTKQVPGGGMCLRQHFSFIYIEHTYSHRIRHTPRKTHVMRSYSFKANDS